MRYTGISNTPHRNTRTMAVFLLAINNDRSTHFTEKGNKRYSVTAALARSVGKNGISLIVIQTCTATTLHLISSVL